MTNSAQVHTVAMASSKQCAAKTTVADLSESPSFEMRRYCALFLSEMHLGTKHLCTEMFLDFVKYKKFETLYLVGDIVHNWALKRSWHWLQLHNDVIQKLPLKERDGTNIVYIPEKFEEEFPSFLGGVWRSGKW